MLLQQQQHQYPNHNITNQINNNRRQGTEQQQQLGMHNKQTTFNGGNNGSSNNSSFNMLQQQHPYSSHDGISSFSSQNSAFKLHRNLKEQIEEGSCDYIPKVLLASAEKQRPYNLLHMTTFGLKTTLVHIKQKPNHKLLPNTTLPLPATTAGTYGDDFPMNYFTDNDTEGSILLPQNKHVRKWPLLFRRFKFISVLGQGRFSQVVLCEDTFALNKRVAIKVMNQKSNEIGIQESLHYFNMQKSQSTTNSCNSQPILKLLLTFFFCGHFCLVFELLGESLLMHIQRFQPFTMETKKVKKIAFQLVTGLALMKHHNVIHADLKPENILMVASNKSSLKIADFGNAINFQDKYHLNSNIGRQLQTLFYRSPEVLFGHSTIDFQIDMWSIGCILAECYIGNPLFNCQTSEDLYRQMVSLLGPVPSIFHNGKFYSQFDKKFNVPPHTESFSFSKRHLKLSRVMRLRSIDHEFTSFLVSILEYDPQKRLTPEKALLHPFLNSVFPFSSLIPSIASSIPQPRVIVENQNNTINTINNILVIDQSTQNLVSSPTVYPPGYPFFSPPSSTSESLSSPSVIANHDAIVQQPPKKIKLTHEQPQSSHMSDNTHVQQPRMVTPTTIHHMVPNPSNVVKKVLPLAPPKRHTCERCGSQLVELSSHSLNSYTIRCKTCKHIFMKNK